MKEILDLISEELREACKKAEIDPKYGIATLSNRPDLCEYQCNGAMAAAKELHKPPFEIAEMIAKELTESKILSSVEVVKPGFINLKLNSEFISELLNQMLSNDRLGVDPVEQKKTIMIDYGGPNVAKPLHVGHLRSAVIGESLKRICRFVGNDVIGDVHLGDWGLQMGLIITELKERKPDLAYFDPDHEGDYPVEPPFTIGELEEIYPTASKKSKEDTDEGHAYKEAALQATFELQQGRRGYRALLDHILNVSVSDLKKNYEKLKVSFELWKGESDAQPYIPDMVKKMKEDGFAYESDGALVVDVAEESDTKEIPPCMILKSDGASLYDTTDLATLIWREADYHPDQVIYVVDKRQEMHFIQVFRCAKKTGIVPEDMELTFVGFGTMNGKDGKPFKTRDGGVMRLSSLLNEIEEDMYARIMEGGAVSESEAHDTAEKIALSAIKYGDLSNQAAKDYVFDVDRFTSTEGNTGPYILYTIVRIGSILKKYEEEGKSTDDLMIRPASSESEKALELELVKFNAAVRTSYEELAPHRLCSFIYDVANAFNHFYHETRILAESDEDRQKGYIALLILTRRVLEKAIELLGFEAPERM